MTFVPEKFKERIRELNGPKGEEWLQALPDLLDRCAHQFGVRVEAASENLSFNLILKATLHNGMPVVLKLVVKKTELSNELKALRAFAGHGMIRVIDADENLGILILERAEPGTPLSTIAEDDLATEIFTNIFRRLHGPPLTDQFPSMEVYFEALEQYHDRCGGVTASLPTFWVERAQKYLAYLISTTTESVLLHGDLHHDNILRQGNNDWVVIDPKGIVGDLHFDVIQYLFNYEDRGGDPYTLLQRRIQIICERLCLEPRRIAMWGVARCILDACWDIEDGGTDWYESIRVAERFAKYLG